MGPDSFVAAYQHEGFAKAVSIGVPAVKVAVNVSFVNGGEWWFTECVSVEHLTDPDRFVIDGNCGGRTALWTIPAVSIKALCVTTEVDGLTTRDWISVPNTHERK